MPKAHVRIGFEHTHREMLPALLLVQEFRRRNINASIEHVSEFGPSSPDHKPTACLAPFYYDSRDIGRYYAELDPQRTAMINLAYEQMHLPHGRGYLLPDGELAKSGMDHFTWGERFEHLLHDHGIDPARTHRVGHPRFDVYHSPQWHFSRSHLAEWHGLREDKDWVLIPGSFNLAYITDRLMHELIGRKYLLSWEMVDVARRSRDAFIELLPRLAKAFPDKEIIFRVHPGGYEADTVYQGTAAGLPNLHVISNYDIANWVMQSSSVLVWSSTTAMESMAGNVPAFAYEPAPYFKRFQYPVGEIAPVTQSEEEVMEWVRTDGRALEYNWEEFERWYAYRDGKNIERLADATQTVLERFAPNPTRGLRGSAERVASRIRRLVNQGKGIRRAPPVELVEKALDAQSALPLRDYLK